MRILVVEDEPEAGEAVRRHLEAAGHHVRLVRDGADGRALGSTGAFDVAILDRLLPSCDGMRILEGWRTGGVTTPVIMLTGLSDVEQRVEGLKAGADDYLPKPFDARELIARIHAMTRRRDLDAAPTRLVSGRIELDLVRRTLVRKGAREIALQPRECSILAELMRNAGMMVTRTMLLEAVWGYGFDPGTNIVESHMSRLRAKLREGGSDPIETLRGLGYRLVAR